MGKVTSVRPDDSGVIRSVVVKHTSGHEAVRPVSHLVPLELGCPDEDDMELVGDSADKTDEEPEPPVLSARALRALRRAARQP